MRVKTKRIGSVLRSRETGRTEAAFRTLSSTSRIGGAIGDATVLCPQQSTAQSHRTVFDICRSAPSGSPA